MFLDARAHDVLCKVLYCLCLRVLLAGTLGIIDTDRAVARLCTSKKFVEGQSP